MLNFFHISSAFMLLIIYNISVKCDSDIWDNQMLDDVSDLDTFVDSLRNDKDTKSGSIPMTYTDTASEQHNQAMDSSSLEQFDDENTYKGIPMLEESEIENGQIDPRERRISHKSFFAGRGKRQRLSNAYDEVDISPDRIRRFGPHTFIGARGKRMSSFLPISSYSSPFGPMQQPTLLKIMRAASKLNNLKSRNIPTKKRRGFTALRG